MRQFGKSEEQFGTFKIAFIAFQTRVYRVCVLCHSDFLVKRAFVAFCDFGNRVSNALDAIKAIRIDFQTRL